jgi:starch synthase (maltosyl-transferring)
LLCYNQFPGNYGNKPFEAMANDLKRIADMGFRQVWINPIFKPCQEVLVDPNKKPGSPYAMYDYLEYNQAYGEINDAKVKQYTSMARSLGMEPLFDFVGRHVAIDCPLVNNDTAYKIAHNIPPEIDTSKWFKRHENVNFEIYRMDEDYQREDPSREPWSDVATFNYDDPKILNEVFEYFWKPFLEKNFELGFTGIRIDAPGYMPKVFHEKIWPYVKKANI